MSVAARLRVPQWTRDMLPPHVPMAPLQTNTVMTCSFTIPLEFAKRSVWREKPSAGLLTESTDDSRARFFRMCWSKTESRATQSRPAEQAQSHHSAYCRLATGKSTAVAPWRPTGGCAFGPNPVLRTRLGTALGISDNRNGAKWSGSPAPACESEYWTFFPGTYGH